MTNEPRRALIVASTMVHRDPRVSRQVESLTGNGWVVDTIGNGLDPAPSVHDHFPLMSVRRWVRSKPGTLLIHGLLPHRLRFKLLTSNRIQPAVKSRIRSGHYQLIVFNDLQFVPWIADPNTFTATALRAHTHLDLHEYFPATPRRDSLYRRFLASYQAWIRRHIGDPHFTTRSTPVRGISSLYAEEFGFSTPAVIRNCPPSIVQNPVPVNPGEIRLVHHGVVNRNRGLYEIVDAMRLIGERFSMTFLPVGAESEIAALKAYARGLEGRVHFVPPVPMMEICSAINQYDLEVMFFPPKTRNLELALPNKFFEAIQGRLGVVIGKSLMMEELVEEHGIGLVVGGWSAQDLAAGLNTLTAEQVAEYKRAAHRIAPDFSAESERQAFLAIVDAN